MITVDKRKRKAHNIACASFPFLPTSSDLPPVETLYRGFNPCVCHNTTKVGIQPIRHVEPKAGRKQRAWHLGCCHQLQALMGWQQSNEPNEP